MAGSASERRLYWGVERILPKESWEALGIIGVGIDEQSVSEMQKQLLLPNFVEDNFTQEEIVYCQRGKPNVRAQRFAAFWALKEAFAKALEGTDGWDFKEIGVIHTERGAPAIALSGSARERAASLRVETFKVSLTHEPDKAIAICAVFGKR